MKLKFSFLCLIILSFTSCKGLLSSQASIFSNDDVKLGMSKTAFINRFGNPSMQNSFKEDGILIEELIYMEAIYFRNEPRKINSTFIFEDGKLTRREQREDQEYQKEQEFKRLMEKHKQQEDTNKE